MSGIDRMRSNFEEELLSTILQRRANFGSLDASPVLIPSILPILLSCPFQLGKFLAMDAKAKKRIEVINKKLPSLKQQLAGAKAQPDDPEEPARLQAEIDKLQAELTKLKAS
jgi:hypothetical protein